MLWSDRDQPVFTQTSADDDIEHKCETVGRKHPPVDVRVIDPSDGHICGPGEPGELCCKRLQRHEGLLQDARGDC